MTEPFRIGEPELEDDDQGEDGDDVCEHGVSFSDDCEDCDELEDEDDEDDLDELEDDDEGAS